MMSISPLEPALPKYSSFQVSVGGELLVADFNSGILWCNLIRLVEFFKHPDLVIWAVT